MDVHSINFDLDVGKASIEFAGSLSLIEAVYKTKVPIYLPNCDASHELVGLWFIDNVQLKPVILTKPITFDLADFGIQDDGSYSLFPPVLFIKSDDWELIADHSVYDHSLSLYYKPKPNGRKNPYARSTSMSLR